MEIWMTVLMVLKIACWAAAVAIVIAALWELG
jgi:hypothetical protein